MVKPVVGNRRGATIWVADAGRGGMVESKLLEQVHGRMRNGLRFPDSNLSPMSEGLSMGGQQRRSSMRDNAHYLRDIKSTDMTCHVRIPPCSHRRRRGWRQPK